MKCNDVRERLVEYLDGELDGGAQADVQGHLGDCAACQKEVAMIEMEQGMLRQVPLTPAPADMGQRVMAALKAQKARAPKKEKAAWWAFLFRPQFALAGGLAAVICVALVWSPGGRPPMDPTAPGTLSLASLAVDLGQVEVVVDGQTRTLATGDRLEIRAGTALACARNSRCSLRFGDRGTVALGAGTRLRAERDQLHLAAGFVHVDYTGGTGREFGVVTSDATLLPLGTNYLVFVTDGRTLAAVNDGKVYFDGRGAGATALDPGQGALLADGVLKRFAFEGSLDSAETLEKAAADTRRAVDLGAGSTDPRGSAGESGNQGGSSLGDLVED